MESEIVENINVGKALEFHSTEHGNNSLVLARHSTGLFPLNATNLITSSQPSLEPLQSSSAAI